MRVAGNKESGSGYPQLLSEFNEEMIVKLDDADLNGRSGWNDPDQLSTGGLYNLFAKARHDKDWVSVANYAMMIWNREQ